MWVRTLFANKHSYSSESHLAKIAHVEQVKGLEQLALLHAEDLGACAEERPDVLQAEELERRTKYSMSTITS